MFSSLGCLAVQRIFPRERPACCTACNIKKTSIGSWQGIPTPEQVEHVKQCSADESVYAVTCTPSPAPSSVGKRVWLPCCSCDNVYADCVLAAAAVVLMYLSTITSHCMLSQTQARTCAYLCPQDCHIERLDQLMLPDLQRKDKTLSVSVLDSLLNGRLSSTSTTDTICCTECTKKCTTQQLILPDLQCAGRATKQVPHSAVKVVTNCPSVVEANAATW